jgi:hypothetical protein
MSLNKYDKGDKVRSQMVFTVNGVPTDPTTITAKVRTPAGVTTPYVYGSDAEVVRVSTGVYRIDISAAQSGLYHVKWVGVGTAEAVEEDSFFVRVPAVA